MELSVLRSDAEFLASSNTALWIECNESTLSLDVAELLLSWGVDLYYFAFPSFNPDNFRGSSSAIYPMAYEAGLLARPRSPPRLDDSLKAHRCILRPISSTEELRTAMWRTPRWGLPEWSGAHTEELAALAGHAILGDRFEDYLRPGWKPGEPPWRVAARLKETLSDRLGELKAARQHVLTLEASVSKLNDGKRAIEILADDLRRELNTARERTKTLNAVVSELEEEKRAAEALAKERLERFRQSDERVRTLEVAISEVEEAQRTAEELANERLGEAKAAQQRTLALEEMVAEIRARDLDRLAKVGAALERAETELREAQERYEAAAANALSRAEAAEQLASAHKQARDRARRRRSKIEDWAKAVIRSRTWRIARYIQRVLGEQLPRYDEKLRHPTAGSARGYQGWMKRSTTRSRRASIESSISRRTPMSAIAA